LVHRTKPHGGNAREEIHGSDEPGPTWARLVPFAELTIGSGLDRETGGDDGGDAHGGW